MRKVENVPVQAQEALRMAQEIVSMHKCYFCGCAAEIFDETFQRYACIDCSDVDHGGGFI